MIGRVVAAAALALALAAPARAQDHECGGGHAGSVPVYQDGVFEEAQGCPGLDAIELVAMPAHGTASIWKTVETFGGTPLEMWHFRYVPDPGLPIGTADSFSYQIRTGSSVSPVYTTRLRIVASPYPPPPPPPAPPVPLSAIPRLHARIAGRSPGSLHLRAGCAEACTLAVVVRRRGTVIARTTATTVRFGRAVRGRLVVDVTATGPTGATATRRLVAG